VIAVGALYAVLLSLRLDLGRDGSSFGSAIAVTSFALAWSVVVGCCSRKRCPGRSSRPVSDATSKRRAVAYMGGMLALGLAPVFIAAWFVDHMGTPTFLAFGPLPGLPVISLWDAD
jgi:hypothetical protein